jgi:hypothetical protein
LPICHLMQDAACGAFDPGASEISGCSTKETAGLHTNPVLAWSQWKMPRLFKA